MNHQPTLSIIIPSHSQLQRLSRCLSRVCGEAPPGCEILVVDDGSADASVSQVARQFNGVRVLRLPERRGFCAAANAGIRATRGEVLHLLNDDTEVMTEWAERALAAFASPRVGAVACTILRGEPGAGEPLVDSLGDGYDPAGFAWKCDTGRRIVRCNLKERDVQSACAAAAFYRRSALTEVGIFAEQFGAYFEDVDLSLRLRRAGWRIRLVPSSIVYHIGSASYGTERRTSYGIARWDGRLLRQQSRNEEWLFWRHRPSDAGWRLLARHAAVLLAKGLLRTIRLELWPFLLGRLDAWRGLGQVCDLVDQIRTLPSEARKRSTEERTSAVASSGEVQPCGSTVTPSSCL